MLHKVISLHGMNMIFVIFDFRELKVRLREKFKLLMPHETLKSYYLFI